MDENVKTTDVVAIIWHLNSLAIIPLGTCVPVLDWHERHEQDALDVQQIVSHELDVQSLRSEKLEHDAQVVASL